MPNFTGYEHQLNTFADIEEYLMIFINNLTIAQIDSILLQESTLSQPTAITNQLTLDSLVSSLYFLTPIMVKYL